MNWDTFPHIKSARERTVKLRDNLELQLRDAAWPQGVCVAVFGSFGRQEFGDFSDLHWTIIYRREGHDVADRCQRSFKTIAAKLALAPPAVGGAFGGTTLDYDLVRDIGKMSDKRNPLSKRMLMLIEGIALGDTSVYDQVVTDILRTYFENQSLLPGRRYTLPRYLINDLLVFWRLMVTDYATSSRGPGWGVRAIKSAMSRQVLFLNGLLWATASRDDNPPEVPNHEALKQKYEHLRSTRGTAPLTRLRQYLEEQNPHAAGRLLLCYDEFLRLIQDQDIRPKLGSLPYADAIRDKDFQAAWEVNRTFHAGLVDTLFVPDEWMRDFLHTCCFI